MTRDDMDPAFFEVPMALDAERAVLGAVLLVGAPALEPLLAETGLRATHFWQPTHAAIYRAMGDLLDRGDGIDRLTVLNELRGYRDDPDIANTVEQLHATPPVTGHAATYADMVMTAARWRARLAGTYRQQQAISERDENAYRAAQETDEPDRGAMLTPAALVADIDKWLTTPDTDRIPVPWPEIHDALGDGAGRGDTTIIAGWSSMGKSIAAAGWLDHVAQHGGRVGLYTNEMQPREIAARLLAAHSGVPFYRILSRRLNTTQLQHLKTAYQALRVNIVPAFGWPAEDICRHMRRQRFDIACLDLFNGLPGLERVTDMDVAIRTLVNAAGHSRTHLLVISQLNQERSKGQERPMPVGRDLRGTGALFNDPANVIFVHRDQEDDGELVVRLDTGVIYVDKARNGNTGARCRVSLNPSRMRFETDDEWRQHAQVEAAA